MLTTENYASAPSLPREGVSETPVLALTTFHLKSLKSLLRLLLSEVEFLEELTPTGGGDWMSHMSLDERLELVEKEILRGALRATGGHQARAAKILNIGTTTLNAKLKRFAIDARLFIAPDCEIEQIQDEEL